MISKKPGAVLLWWIAFISETIAATLETVSHQYLKAASLFCLALTFLILAINQGEEGIAKSVWLKVVLYILVFASIGLIVYQIVIGKFFIS